jgi:hypothetical protein
MPSVSESLRGDLSVLDPKKIDDFMKEFLEIFLERVVERTPVKTGLLQASWGGEVKGDVITIENPVEYASYVEYGTVKMAPRAMLRTTMEESDQIAQEAMKRI